MEHFYCFIFPSNFEMWDSFPPHFYTTHFHKVNAEDVFRTAQENNHDKLCLKCNKLHINAEITSYRWSFLSIFIRFERSNVHTDFMFASADCRLLFVEHRYSSHRSNTIHTSFVIYSVPFHFESIFISMLIDAKASFIRILAAPLIVFIHLYFSQ